MSTVSLDRELDRLFAAPLDEFTASRNELMRRLKKEGYPEAAEQVGALAKPSIPVWTINQLARQEKQAVRKLLDAGEKLRKAQERALSGGGPDALREAQGTERDALRDLTQRASGILDDAGRPATSAVLDRIRSTLSAAALSDPARAALKAGRLTDELQLSGFDALAGIEATPRRSAPKDELAERRKQKAERERELRRLQKKARDLETKATAAELAADQAEEAAVEARELADERRQAADAAAADLEEFERS